MLWLGHIRSCTGCAPAPGLLQRLQRLVERVGACAQLVLLCVCDVVAEGG